MGRQARSQQRRLTGTRRADKHDRQVRVAVSRQADEALGDLLAPEEPARVLSLEPGETPVGGIAGRAPAGWPPRPAKRLSPPGELFRVGHTACPEQLQQRLRLRVRGQVASGEVVASRADRQACRSRNLPDGHPGCRPDSAQLAAEVLLCRDLVRITSRACQLRPSLSSQISPRITCQTDEEAGRAGRPKLSGH